MPVFPADPAREPTGSPLCATLNHATFNHATLDDATSNHVT